MNRRYVLWIGLALLCTTNSNAPAAGPQEAGSAPDATVLVETEDFQFAGGWMRTGSHLQTSISLETIADAMTVVELPRDATYHLWVYSRDFAEYMPKTRRYRVTVDGTPMKTEGGAHGREGWAWECLGTVDLKAGEHLLGLQHISSRYARCGALLLSTADLDPNRVARSQLAAWRIHPKRVVACGGDGIPTPPPIAADAVAKTLATLNNDRVRITFQGQTDATGVVQVTRHTAIRDADRWRDVAGGAQGELLFLLYRDKVQVSYHEGRPVWQGTGPSVAIRVQGKRVEVRQSGDNPYAAGQMNLLVGREARQVDDETVVVRYVSAKGVAAEGRWTLKPGCTDVRLELTFKAAKAGFYSAGICPFGGVPAERAKFVQLPPLFQFQRLPNHPCMLTNVITPHAMALAEIEQTDAGDSPLCLAVVAEPTALPLGWPTATDAAFGFSLLGPASEIRPSGFAPVLGFGASRCEAGEVRKAAWRVLAYPGDWKAGLEYVSNRIMQVRDYRKPVDVSLSQAAVNMIDLMRNADASGWSAEMKGFYNIEKSEWVTHASPLTVVAASILSRDEKLYVDRALPTIEYTLTRPTAFWTRPHEKPVRLRVPTSFYGTPYWQGLHDLLGRLNPWLEEFALPGGDIRHSQAYNSSADWTDLLAAYRWRPDAKLLDEIRRRADQFLETELYGPHETPVPFSAFYNISFYPYWWDLIDLYELTDEPRYLKAAEEGAFHTIAGLWSHPVVPEGDMTVHPGGQFAGLNIVWWKDRERFRLGDPREPGDTPAKQIPAWQVARVGLGLEQPSTYFAHKGCMRNIMMSVWAPHLLRVFQHTDRDIYRVYARNTIVGRFGNYPGYYQVGYSDLMLDPKYPYAGPDVTGIYYHHIPPHLAFTIDFLAAQAGARSGGNIRFPWAKQQGYAWFTNRVYGLPGGEIFGQPAGRILLDGRAVHIDDKNVDWLASRSRDRLWLILMSQADTAVTVRPKLDAQRLGLKPGAPFRSFTVDHPQGIEQAADRPFSVTVPAKGLVALSLPASPCNTFPDLPPLSKGHFVRDAGRTWGDLHAFRIRSPFGSDSIYVALTGGPVDGGSATLTITGRDAPLVKQDLPYEFSVHPWPIDRPCELKVQTRGPGDEKPQTFSLSLPGTPKKPKQPPEE